MKNILDIQNRLTELYHRRFSCRDHVAVIPLPQAGGDRRYFRMSGTSGICIGSFDPDSDEAKCFVSLSEVFRSEGAAVPQVFAHSDDFRFYLQEDLGDRSLFSVLGDPDATSLVEETLHRLVALQKIPADKWSGLCIAAPFCRRQVIWDLNYFKYEYLKPSEVIFSEDRLEDDFELLASDLCGSPDEFLGFMMRDCQSRNVIISSGGPTFIDFQGGRRGPVLYDAVSFLWQARAAFSSSFRQKMAEFYADVYCEGSEPMKRQMLSMLPLMVLFRTLQVLGAYGFRGLVQHRAHFIMSIPGALRNLGELVSEGVLDRYPELKKVSSMLVADSRFATLCETEISEPSLCVEIFSFSYKKGYPADFSDNGGGFMFDCRAMHNPGRYKEYKQLTGRDKPVVDFLERRGEVRSFLRGAWSLTDPAVERYLKRGFSKLQIGFGCTGGQHRSVYCAEATARHIAEVFPEAKVLLIHREHPAESDCGSSK